MQRGTINGAFRMFGHKLIIILGRVIAIELIQLDDVYQFLSILRIGGIACSLQSLRPALIVCDLQLE